MAHICLIWFQKFIASIILNQIEWLFFYLITIDVQFIRYQKRIFLNTDFCRNAHLFASWLRTFHHVLGLRINDVEKICPSSILCRLTQWTTLFQSQPRIHYRMSYRIFWSVMTNYCKVPFGQQISKIHIFRYFWWNLIIIFLFCRSYRGEYEKIKRQFLEINLGGKKILEVTLYTRTVFTSVMRVNVGVFHEIL